MLEKILPFKQEKKKIYPIFLPFFACGKKCIYCAQNLQTGQDSTDYKQILDTAYQDLEKKQTSLDLAFYGGTFTAIKEDIQKEFLDLAKYFKNKAIINEVRCSTRPDAITEKKLELLKNYDLDLIELGVQTFNDVALNITKRPYNAKLAKQACNLIKEYGFDLGIQLLPGLPKVTPNVFIDDAKEAILLQPKYLRFYPCMVIKDTELANMYLREEYVPWGLDDTLKSLGYALYLAHTADITVIRLALAPQPELDSAILAGPKHESLGSMVQAEALEHILNNLPYGTKNIALPASFQGFYAGYKNEKLNFYKNYNISWYAL